MRKAYYFAFPCKDFLIETALFTPEQRGAYIALLAHAWVAEPPCTLPSDDTSLGQLSGMKRRWVNHGAVVKARFTVIDGRLRCDWQHELFIRMVSEHERKSAAGKKGSAMRWNTANRESNGVMPNNSDDDPF